MIAIIWAVLFGTIPALLDRLREITIFHYWSELLLDFINIDYYQSSFALWLDGDHYFKGWYNYLWEDGYHCFKRFTFIIIFFDLVIGCLLIYFGYIIFGHWSHIIFLISLSGYCFLLSQYIFDGFIEYLGKYNE